MATPGFLRLVVTTPAASFRCGTMRGTPLCVREGKAKMPLPFLRHRGEMWGKREKKGPGDFPWDSTMKNGGSMDLTNKNGDFLMGFIYIYIYIMWVKQ